MSVKLIVTFAILLSGCGAYEDASNELNATATATSTATATGTPTATATAAATGVTVNVNNTINNGGAVEPPTDVATTGPMCVYYGETQPTMIYGCADDAQANAWGQQLRADGMQVVVEPSQDFQPVPQ